MLKAMIHIYTKFDENDFGPKSWSLIMPENECLSQWPLLAVLLMILIKQTVNMYGSYIVFITSYKCAI